MEFRAPTGSTDYDEVPYPGNFYAQSTPLRQATMATLFGMTPPTVECCRVLEIGCGDGCNLIPLAYVLPDSEFVGIDLSSTAVAAGISRAKQLRLTNVQLCARNLMDFPADAGQFDYIIAHGIYSWVPLPVRQQLLKICSKHLADNGVAYISYNALPGGFLRRYARDLMLFHTRAMTDPATKIAEARNILEFVVSAQGKPTIEREILSREIAKDKPDAYVYHDILGDVNDPIYFLDFLDQAAQCGLQFLAEATPNVASSYLSESVRQQLDALPDRRIREQYLDFIFGRRFRQTLLCRVGHTLKADYDARTLNRLLVRGSLVPTAPVSNFDEQTAVEFRTPRGITVKVREALPKAVYLELGKAFPNALAFEELLTRSCVQVGLQAESIPSNDREKVERMLLSSYLHGVVQFEPFQAKFTCTVSERPTASTLARMQAESGATVISMALMSYAMPEQLSRKVLALADGSRDMEQILQQVSRNGEDVTSESVRNTLEYLAKSAMFVA